MKRNVALLIFLLPAHLYSMDKPSGDVIIPDRVDQYKFSPDGRRLLTLKSVSPNHLAKNYLVNLYATATCTLLKSFPGRMSARFKWSPKGTYFAFKGLNLTEVLIMDQHGDLIRTVKTNGTIHKFNFSDSEKCIYYDFIERTSSSHTALNYQVMETTIASGLTTSIAADDFKNNVLSQRTHEEGLEVIFSEPILLDKDWYTLTGQKFISLDSKYTLRGIEKIGDDDPHYVQLLITSNDEDPKQAVQSSPMPATKKLFKPFHYVHYTHNPSIIILASDDALLYTVNITTKQVILLNFDLKKSELIKWYDTQKRKVRPFISKNGMYLQDHGNQTKIRTLNWN